MIAEIIPEAYDAIGRKTTNPEYRKTKWHLTVPFGRYVSHPLQVNCKDLQELRLFLMGCKGVSDKKQFGKDEYFQPPEDFERTRKGDCDCFALWTWRQLMHMGYRCRLVLGSCGWAGHGHAWLTFSEERGVFLLDPTKRYIARLPRLSTLWYRPNLSVEWDGSKMSYSLHSKQPRGIGLKTLLLLLPEYIAFWLWFWLKGLFFNIPRRLLLGAFRRLRKVPSQ